MVLNELESRQIGGIINERAEKRGFFIELPIGQYGDSGSAKLWVRGKRDQGSNAIEPEYFNLDFELDTSSAGLIKGNISSMGKSLSIRFNFGNEKSLKIAESMSSELRDLLSERGFSVGLLNIAGFPATVENSGDLQGKSGLDLIG